MVQLRPSCQEEKWMCPAQGANVTMTSEGRHWLGLSYVNILQLYVKLVLFSRYKWVISMHLPYQCKKRLIWFVAITFFFLFFLFFSISFTEFFSTVWLLWCEGWWSWYRVPTTHCKMIKPFFCPFFFLKNKFSARRLYLGCVCILFLI